MDHVVIAQKLESLRRCVARVALKRPATAQALMDDIDAQDVVVLNLSRAVQLCVDMAMHHLADSPQNAPQTMGQSFELLAQQGIISQTLATRMRKAVGFRNLAVHSYDKIEWELVYLVSGDQLEDFRQFAKAMAS